MRAAKNSLRLLGTDYIDLYQIHWPNSSVPMRETMRAMEELADAGKVRYIGVSNFSVREMEEARAAMTRHPIVSNQVHYSLKRRGIKRDVLPYCQENQITVIAYTPLETGSLAVRAGGVGALQQAAGRLLGREREHRALTEIAEEAGKTPAQVALNWCVSHPGVIAIPKSNSLARTDENCGASGWRLTDEQMQRLDQAFPR